MAKDVISIVCDQLRVMGADGLCTEDCGCGLEDLAPCGAEHGSFIDCIPAKKRPITQEECDTGRWGWCDLSAGDDVFVPMEGE